MKNCLRASLACILGIGLMTSAHTSHTHSHNSGADARVVFNRIPRDRADFQEDVAPLINQIIARHGEQEWEIVVLTNEFHRHLGIYSILGAKMGLAAREHFHVGLDELTIQSHAGLQPPISCLNDGLQVSTGATLGHGTIRIAEGGTPLPSARFTHDDQSITLTLKPTYWNQIKTDIQQTLQTHGLKTPDYWDAVRQLGLRYWLQWSRAELFETSAIREPMEHNKQRWEEE